MVKDVAELVDKLKNERSDLMAAARHRGTRQGPPALGHGQRRYGRAQDGGEVHVLVAGSGSKARPTPRKLAGVTKVLHVDAAHYDGGVAENYAALVVGSPRLIRTCGERVGLRQGLHAAVAALLDVAPVSEISAVESADTFVRPIYAGNAFATVQSADAIKVVTVRATGFDAAAAKRLGPVKPRARPDRGQAKVCRRSSPSRRGPSWAGRAAWSRAGAGLQAARTSRC